MASGQIEQEDFGFFPAGDANLAFLSYRRPVPGVQFNAVGFDNAPRHLNPDVAAQFKIIYQVDSGENN